ncbi:MAG: hypothetical protein AB7Y46_17730, partial [Armatimonadota bacterium]
ANGSTFDSGASVDFAGMATDAEDGDLSGSLVWTSSRDGQIGTGGSFSAVLSDGSHTITASVTDAGGLSDSATVSVTVGSQPPSGGMYVWDIAWSKTGPHLVIAVTVLVDSDADGRAEATDQPVSGATVAMSLTRGTSSWSFTGTTDSSGRVQFMHKRAASGDYTATVNSISHSAYHYDPSLDADNPDSYTL